MEENQNKEPSGKPALEMGADFIKYSLALSTGTLVFSAGLLSEEITIEGASKVLLFIAWVSIALSVLSGLLAFSRIPILLKDENYDLEDKFLVYPGRAHQILFALGVLCLGITLLLALLSR